MDRSFLGRVEGSNCTCKATRFGSAIGELGDEAGNLFTKGLECQGKEICPIGRGAIEGFLVLSSPYFA